MQKITLKTHRDLNIPGLLRRPVNVWLPEQYEQNPSERFPVLYIQDGQMVFDHHNSKIGGWIIHKTISALAVEEKITPPIVVAISSTLNRLIEYLPGKALDYQQGIDSFLSYASERLDDTKREMSDKYVNWVVDTVKPTIDQQYRTLPEMENTALMGSSMGGMVSLYLLCEFPQVFSKAACLSTHWTILGDGMVAYLQDNLPDPGNHKLYFDYGDQGLDRDYGPWQAKVDALLNQKGYREGKDFASWSFPGEDHTTQAWSARIHIPLTFLFGTIDK